MIAVERRETEISGLAEAVRQELRLPGRRFGHLTARVADDRRLCLETLLLDTRGGGATLLTAPMPEGCREYPSLATSIPAAHRAERATLDAFGLRPTGHRQWKSLVLHDDVWPVEFAPLAPDLTGARESYTFRRIEGEGVHEIPVGPIHAGIIEPGHFRFSCVGEVITYLEIRLGYQHRGVEKRLAELAWQRMRFLAESASSDTAVGNALAHCEAIESLLGVEAPERARALRTVALEMERLANHVGDLGAIAGDIGFNPGAGLLPPLRGLTLRAAQLLTGNRRQRWYVRPGGVTRDLDPEGRREFARRLGELKTLVRETIPLLLENPAAIDRMSGVGVLPSDLAEDFGLVGPAARASAGEYDARACFRHGVYPREAPTPARRESGDALARVRIRADEIETSFEVLERLIGDLPGGPVRCDCESAALPPSSVGVGIVEAWRGELIHWVTTDASGAVSRYAIKDPSLNNWTGLAIAARGNLVADFPLCNKSFNLSYCGNDL